MAGRDRVETCPHEALTGEQMVALQASAVDDLVGLLFCELVDLIVEAPLEGHTGLRVVFGNLCIIPALAEDALDCSRRERRRL